MVRVTGRVRKKAEGAQHGEHVDVMVASFSIQNRMLLASMFFDSECSSSCPFR